MVITSDMLCYLLLFASLVTAFLVHSMIKNCSSKNRTQSLIPPSPPSLPIIGHLHLIGSVPTKSLQTLASQYGPLMKIRLGASTCVVVSDAGMAREIFKNHDLNFSWRPEFGSSEYFIYRGSRFVLAPYGDYWRFMKKLCMTRLFSTSQLEKFVDFREIEIVKIVEKVFRCAKAGRLCDLNRELTTLTNNIICRLAMSTKCSGNDNEAEEIKSLVHTCLQLSGRLSMGDILGPLKCFDFSGTGKKLVGALLKYDNIVERFLKEHEEKAMKGFGDGERKDLVDILLETYNDPNAQLRLSRNDIKSFLLDMFLAGTDTSSSGIEWAMAELINNKTVLNKLRDEINTVVGLDRLIQESDVQNLPFLRAVIRETLRLHPSAPLIIRQCDQNCKIKDYSIKSKTRILVNVYAIMRDPKNWSNPNEFIPDRFMEESSEKITEHRMEYKGQNFRYLPFGSGRRACPGASLAMLVMHQCVGALVQCFDWKLEYDQVRVDLSVGSGFGAELAKPLVCFPVAYNHLVLSKF